MGVKFTNNAFTTLSSSVSAGATSLSVASVSTFPSLGGGDHMYVSLTDEVVKVTAISGTTLTCVATSGAHSAGISVELRMTAELLNDFAEDEEALPLAGGAMTGNITMAGSQTVDGRDLSVDGAKLDAIEANATADQTAAQIKTLLEDGIDSVHYVDGSIDAEHIADDAVTEAKLANAINTAIAANTAKTTNATHTGDVTGSGALTIAADAVTGDKIADNAIDSEHYTDGSIDREHLAADIVDGTKIADDSINSEHIAADSIDAEHYAAGSVDTTALGADSVTTAKIADNVTLGGNVTISGNLTVSGTETTVNTATLAVEDPLVSLATGNNGSDAIDIGVYGLYDTSGSQDLYSGLFRDASDSGKWKLFKDNQAAPTTTVNTSGTGYAVGTLVANLEGAVTGDLTGQAATATKLHTARAFTTSGDVVVTSTNFDGTANFTAAATIQTGAVEHAMLAADCVDGDNIGDDVINSEHYAAASIDNEHLADNAVGTAEIADDAVTADKLANSINTDIATGVTANTTANAALPKAGGTMTGNLVMGTNLVDGIDISARDAVLTSTTTTAGAALPKAGGTMTGDIVMGANKIGADAGDYIAWTNNTHTSFVVNANEEMRLEADGDLHVDGDVIAFSSTISDETLKYDINPIEHALDKVAQLTGVTYKYLKDGMESAGLLAQDVEKVMPCAVSERKLPLHKNDGKSYKTLNYDNLHALLIESIKELTAKVEKLEKK